MSNKNKKNYKKIYLNGECLIDFTQQTVNENNVASGNMFFDTEGNLIEGKDDSNEFIKGMLNVYDYTHICPKDSLYLNCLTKFGASSTISSIVYSSYFPYIQYIKYGTVDTISTNTYDYDCYSDRQHSIYLSKIAVAANEKSSFYTTLINNTYSSNFYGQVFCQDDLSQFELPPYNTDLIISNCSEIKTTKNGTFDYVVANNKVYIISLNHEKSYLDREFIYDDTYSFPYSPDSEETTTVSGVSIKFPDEIEGLPVVSLGAGIFGYAMSSNYGYDYDSSYSISSILRINFPKDLEILNANSFSSFNRNYGPAIKFPNKLRTINDNATETYNATFYGDSSMFSEETLPLPDSLINMPAVTLRMIGEALNYQGVNIEYIPTESNNIAYYLGANSSNQNITIAEGCIGVVGLPYNVVSVSFPASIKSLGRIGNKSSLTTVSFAETIAAKNIPSSFIHSSSNLTTIVLPEGIETIDSYGFSYAYLTDITLPSTLKYIGFYGLSDNYSISTKTIKIKAKTPPVLYSTSSLTVYGRVGKIIVPKGCLDTYKKASNWSSYASKMEESTEW